MCQRLGKRKRIDRFETVRQFYRNDTYGWNSFVNAVNFGVKFHGSSDEFCYYLDKRPARQKLYDKLWNYHNKTNLVTINNETYQPNNRIRIGNN